ncbi:g3677 [Coccomyxa viridis]|uniref:G3677 protein n=1 Tax=Coccomyxa viridis TaxID=1274662 RepID=A0ABP1FNC1_9CHLO
METAKIWVLDGLRLAVSHCKVEPLAHAGEARQLRQAGASTQRPSRAPSRTSSASEEDLSRGRHASWQELPPELIALIFQRASVRERKLCRLVCKGWRRGVDTLVTRLQVGPHNRDQQPWNRQLLMLEKLPRMFPCLREINFDQGVGSDVLVRDPGLPYNLGIIPSVPIIKVTSSRTKLHLAATRALAAREDVKSFGLSLPSPTTDLELMELMTWTAPRLTCLEIQQAHELSPASLRCLSRASHLEALALEGMQVVGTEGWSALSHLTRLTSLAVRSRGDNSGLHHLSTLRRLQDLRLKVREIDVEGIDAMRSLTDLRSIDLEVWVSPVRPRVIEALLSFTRLEAVRLEAYSSLETACCFSALKHLPALTHLDLRLSGSHYALGDNVEALHSLAKCLRLETLALAAPAPSLGALSSTSRLRMLRLCDASMLSNRITGAELPELPNLVHLNLIHCGAVTDEGLSEIAGRFPQLQTLQLKTPWITDAGMGHVNKLSLLERLDLVDCEGVEGPGLAQLLVNHPNLVTVNVTGNDKALSAARKACAGLNPDLDISRGRYPFEMESSLNPLVDRLYL